MIRDAFPSIDISASGLAVQRTRMNITSNNIANVNTTKTDGQPGIPYKRKRVLLSSESNASTFQLALQRSNDGLRLTNDRHLSRGVTIASEGSGIPGVRVEDVVEDDTPPRMIYDPVHPDANAEGYVAMPDINIVVEMVDMISATRAYEANITAINAAKTMARQAIEL
jgi:flagellar basal-body rod protein FlgC